MTNEEIFEKVKSALGEDIRGSEVSLGDPVLFVGPGSLHRTAELLKNDPDLDFLVILDCTWTILISIVKVLSPSLISSPVTI